MNEDRSWNNVPSSEKPVNPIVSKTLIVALSFLTGLQAYGTFDVVIEDA